MIHHIAGTASVGFAGGGAGVAVLEGFALLAAALDVSVTVAFAGDAVGAMVVECVGFCTRV